MTPQPASSESTNLDRRPDATPGISGLRLWLFRLMALALAPCLLLALEGMLRLSGYGYATSFLQPVAERDGWWTTNPQFSWRFFPRHLARSPVPFELSEEAEDQRRIFIIGGSAARGTPDSAYNFGRMLGVMLEHSYPEIELEIFNAAMTAINSHVARVIVDDLEPRRGDLFIIYMGNNEVVGPFGAGTIFGQNRVLHRALPSLPAIRASIALNATRSGQLLASLIAASDRATSSEWRGMEMFVEQVVDPADPRLAQVRSHFRSNLASIIQTLQRAGADTLLMTVATNLRDQAPFASLLPSEVTEDDARRWHELYEAGRDAAASGSHREAVDALAQAAGIEDRHAELRFHLGQAHLALGAPERAKPHLIAARDLDALRFRADSEINQAIRGVAEDTGVPLLDAAQRFLDGTEEIPELPGYRLFHEHVHFNFAGNYALASAAHQHLASRLDSAPSANPRAQLTQQQVAERLAFTRFDELELERDILRLVSRPPFTDDPAQDADVARRWQHLAELEAGLDAASWSQAEALYLQRLDIHPLDLEARRRFAGLLQARQPEASISHWRFLLDRIPHHGRWRTSLALALADSGQTEAALAELRTVEQRQGVSADSLVNRGTVLETSGDDKAAEATYRRAVELDPRHTLARFNLATAALRRGACDEAIRRYRQLLEREADFAPAHHNLGRCHERQGELEAATLAYRDAIRADPGFASAYNSLGLALEQQGEEAAALAAYRNAVAYRQEFALAHFNLADLLWSQGKHAEAANAYERGLSYRPDNPQARYNRAGALMAAGDDVEAAAELAKVVDQRGEPGELHNLAWILATSERPELRDPQRAVELAERAARATRRQSAEILETLAAAYGAAGRRDDATATLHSAASLARAQGRHGLANRLERRLRGRR